MQPIRVLIGVLLATSLLSCSTVKPTQTPEKNPLTQREKLKQIASSGATEITIVPLMSK